MKQIEWCQIRHYLIVLCHHVSDGIDSARRDEAATARIKSNPVLVILHGMDGVEMELMG
jgi:hypothetical protein